MDSLILRVGIFSAFLYGAFTNTTKGGNLGFRDSRHMLMSQLTEHYDPRILPVINSSHAVDVEYHMDLYQIIALEEKNQILRIATWTRISWTDEFLTWDPADFDGIKEVYMNVDSIWRPDIVLYQSVDEQRSAFEVFPAGVMRVSHEGWVIWASLVYMQSLCKIKVDAYPFDVQTCPLKFGSWTYNGLRLNLTSKFDKIRLQNYVPSIEWQVIDTPCQTNVVQYLLPFPDVTCHLVIRRRPAFYLFNLVLPTALLLVIGLLVFCLPPESGEKVSLAITVLLSMSVYMLIVMENVPPNAEAIPLLELFIGGTLCMLTMSTIMAVFVVNFHFRGSYSRPPYWVRCCCMGSVLTTICCLKRQVKDIEDEDELPVTSNNATKNEATNNNATNNEPTSNNATNIEATSNNATNNVATSNNATNNEATSNNATNIESTSNNATNNEATSNSHSLQHDRGGVSKMSMSLSEKAGSGTTKASPRHYQIKIHGAETRTADSSQRQMLAELRQQGQGMRERSRDKKAASVAEAEWRLVAMCVDRLFFAILLPSSLIMALLIFKDVL